VAHIIKKLFPTLFDQKIGNFDRVAFQKIKEQDHNEEIVELQA